MKKAIIAAALCVSLGGCLPTLNIASQVNLNTVEGVVSGYGLVVNAENVLKETPLCKTGTTPSITNICVRRSVIERLQNADRIANSAVNKMVAFVKNNPTIAPTQYIAAAQDALLSVQVVVNSARN